MPKGHRSVCSSLALHNCWLPPSHPNSKSGSARERIIVAKKSLMDKFKEFVEASTESNVPMTGREIAKTKAKKKAKTSAVKRAIASNKTAKKASKKSTKRRSKKKSKKAGKKSKR